MWKGPRQGSPANMMTAWGDSPPSLPSKWTLTFFRTTNSFSAVALRATSSSYLDVGRKQKSGSTPQILPQLLAKFFQDRERD